jgi:YD repeat-containing protein
MKKGQLMDGFLALIYLAGLKPVNISANANAGVSTSATSVTVRMMDIDGDGLVDQVLRIPLLGTYAKLNLCGKAGLLKKITLPQGGSYELEYERAGNTTDMPQCRYVLLKLTMKDSDTFTGRDANQYTTNFSYTDGYYDRIKKDFYGFSSVKTVKYDVTEETEYSNRHYYSKGMEVRRTVKDYAIGVKRSEVINVIDAAPFARTTETRTTRYGEGGVRALESRVRYAYGAYGNVTRFYDDGDVNDSNDDIRADIEYWNDGAKYLHNHPAGIAVYNASGTLLRLREGDYTDNGSLSALRQYYGGGKNLEHRFTYDSYGNMKSVTDPAGASVGYEYDGPAKQYITKVLQQGGAETYTSTLEWDAKRGLKTKETDANGNSISYQYDNRQRLKEIRTSYDTGATPAVAYQYNTQAGGRWYAVTANKITFDPADNSVMLTVIEIDGLGRARQSAKAGAVYNTAAKSDESGWNVLGAVKYDLKGRTIEEGQTYFVRGAEGAAGVAALLTT